MKTFNTALLAKQGWRLSNEEDTLLCRILKARYFPDGSFMTTEQGSNSSYSWRSLCSARSLIQQGTGWRVGDGRTIEVSTANWIPSTDGFRPPFSTPRLYPGLRVENLFLQGTRMWNHNLLDSLLDSVDAAAVKRIPLSWRTVPDKRMWWPNKNGEFSVRSAYWLGSCAAVEQWHNLLQSSNDDLWRLIWRMKTPHKIKHFAWRVCTNSIPVKRNLKRRNISDDDACPLCNQQEETAWHALIECLEADLAWTGSPLLQWARSQQFINFNVLLQDLRQLFSMQEVKEFWIRAWISWTIRNKRLFELGFTNAEVLRDGFFKYASDYDRFSAARRITPRNMSLSSWVRPPTDVFKINIDAHVAGSEFGLGVVVRDCSGTLKMVASRRMVSFETTTMAEALALKWAVELVLQWGYFRIILESDCSVLIDALQSASTTSSYQAQVIEDIRVLCSSFDLVSFSKVCRTANTVADLAARLSPDISRSLVFLCNFPQGIVGV